MRLLKHNSINISIVILLLLAISCKKEVRIDPPVTKLVTINVFDNDNTAIAAILGIYAQMINLPIVIHQYNALSSDEFFNYYTSPFGLDIYNNSLNAGDNLGLWSNAYNLIYQANAAIENLKISNGVSNANKDQLTGEAEFIRAYWLFYLVNTYGDVPIVTSTDPKVNAVLARATKNQVYTQIIADLSDAQSKLSSSYLDGNNIPGAVDRVRPTSWAASALLAKVYLYTGNNYDKAIALSSTVIKNTASFNLPALNKTFKQNSVETIWSLPNVSTAPNYTNDGYYFILYSAPSSGLTASAVISSQLMSAFENGDQRKTTWINSYTSGSNTWYYPYKYQAGTSSTSLTEYTIVLRLADQYLIRAEAEANSGDLVNAASDLNIIRNRAGLANYAGTIDKPSMINAILHERQVEFFAEGERWFDLKKTGTIDAVMGIVTPLKGGGQWNTTQQLYPIPQESITNDRNIIQNPGY